jgi:hypothetical protein
MKHKNILLTKLQHIRLLLKNGIKKHKIISSLIVLLMIFYPYYQYLAYKNRQGYCFKEQRILSTQEKIDRMLEYVYKQPQPEIVPGYLLLNNKFIGRGKYFEIPRHERQQAKFYPLALKKEYADQPKFIIDANSQAWSSEVIERFFYSISYYDIVDYVYNSPPEEVGYQASFAEFKALNKNCCSFYTTAKTEDNGIYEIEKDGGTLNYIGMNVTYWYDENWAHQGSPNYKPQKRYISKYDEYPITNCGENSWEKSTQTLIQYDDPKIAYTTPFAVAHFLWDVTFKN